MDAVQGQTTEDQVAGPQGGGSLRPGARDALPRALSRELILRLADELWKTMNPAWRTSSRSGNGGECVEVGHDVSGMIMVRDTKNRAGGPVCRYTPAGWRTFVARIRCRGVQIR